MGTSRFYIRPHMVRRILVAAVYDRRNLGIASAVHRPLLQETNDARELLLKAMVRVLS
jgi:hypothetical protein